MDINSMIEISLMSLITTLMKYYKYGVKLEHTKGANLYINVPERSDFKDEEGNELAGEVLAKALKVEILKGLPEGADKIVHVRYTITPMRWTQVHYNFAEEVVNVKTT